MDFKCWFSKIVNNCKEIVVISGYMIEIKLFKIKDIWVFICKL
jgi:hypothetical protein